MLYSSLSSSVIDQTLHRLRGGQKVMVGLARMPFSMNSLIGKARPFTSVQVDISICGQHFQFLSMPSLFAGIKYTHDLLLYVQVLILVVILVLPDCTSA